MMEIEKTLVLLKPDAVKRGLIGQIIDRFEKVGLTIVGMKMVVATDEIMNKHYPIGRESFVMALGYNTLTNSRKLGVDVKKVFGTEDQREVGLKIQSWTVKTMQSGPNSGDDFVRSWSNRAG